MANFGAVAPDFDLSLCFDDFHRRVATIDLICAQTYDPISPSDHRHHLPNYYLSLDNVLVILGHPVELHV